VEVLGEIESLNLISDEPGPDRRLAAHQELERLQAIVARLPARCRRAFELRKFQGLSHREVAEHMGLSEKTIENHLTRALAAIAAAWSSDEPGVLGSRMAARAEGAPLRTRPDAYAARTTARGKDGEI